MEKFNNNSSRFSRFLRNNYRTLYLISFFAILLAILGLIFALKINIFWGVGWIVLVLLIAYLFYNFINSLGVDFQTYMTNLYGRVSISQTSALEQMPIGIMLLDSDFRIEWFNKSLEKILGNSSFIGKNLKEVDSELFSYVQSNKKGEAVEIDWHQGKFLLQVQNGGQAIYLMDMTDISKYQIMYEKNRLFYGIINIDNYEEIIRDIPDYKASSLVAFFSSRLGKWSKKYHLFLQRISENRYLIFGRMPDLNSLEKDHFSIVDDIREESLKQNMPLSLSIGIACGVSNLNKLSQLAQRSLDLALGRGGDQVVIREKDNPAIYFGGNSNPLEKRTRVRARMMETALSDLFDNSDSVFIAGHRNPDMDSLGSALGIWRMSQIHNLNKVYIIINEKNLQNEIRLVIKKIDQEIDQKNKKIKQDDKSNHSLINYPFISEKQAMSLADDKSLLVLVDHCRPSISSAGYLLDKLKSSLVVIDHHRVADESFKEKPQLFYIEQSASSTSELVTELLGYEDLRKSPISEVEATALLGGIQLDTKGFTFHTGSRTFDAASFLRSSGANSDLLRRFKKEPESFVLTKSHLIQQVSIKNNVGIITGEDKTFYDPIVCAQAVDSLLKIQGIAASFIIFRVNDDGVKVSARSDGSLNVQVIMEKMGGGGSLANAASVVKNHSTEEVTKELRKIIDSVVLTK